jgi:hypothetical protein
MKQNSMSQKHDKSFGGMKNFYHHGKHYNFHHYNRFYHGWSRYCWFPGYGCYGYYCPTRCCWYCYCGQYECFVPVQYVTEFVPTPVVAPVGVVDNVNTNTNTNTNVNVNMNNSNSINGALPTGAVALPGGMVPPAPVGPAGVQQ